MASVRGTDQELSPYKGRFIWPIPGRLGRGFGRKYHPILRRRRMHNGQDIAAPRGTPIKAAGPGIVIEARWRGGYGRMILIDHGGGISTLYGHCSRIRVKAGQKVQQGQIIGNVGSTGLSTGPHLHLEVRVNGRPRNPRPYFPRR